MTSIYHKPVLLNECIEGLNINPDGIYVDVTFGGGGHSKEILKHLNNGKLLAFDQDKDAEQNKINDERFIFIKSNFRYLGNFLKYLEIEHVDGILADLGVSSHHFDDAKRGFSFRFDAELDMRMNQESDFSAKELINTYSSEKLVRIFREYGEIKNAYKLAQTIDVRRKERKIETINDFLNIIQNCISKKQRNKYLATVFQALRIEVNNEMGALKEFLQQTTKHIKVNGQLVILTYHSLEDRLVKNFIRTGNFDGKQNKDIYGNIIAPFKAVNRKVIVPDEIEIEQNNRARSAKLRIAKRIDNE